MAHQVDPVEQRRWAELVTWWRRSKLTGREFCRMHHVSEPKLYSWRRILLQRKTPAFVKVDVEPTPSPRAIEVVLGRRIVRVTPGFDADTLQQLVRMLEEPGC